MPAVEDDSARPRFRGRGKRQGQPRAKSSSSQRGTQGAPKRPRPKSPPNRVNPGWVHELAGSVGLKLLQAIAERNGIHLSIGDVGLEDLTPEVMQENGPQPKEVASRLAAHVAHRVPGVRRIEKRMEGQDKTSGIVSDIGVLLGQLYRRNKIEVDGVISRAISDRFSQKRTKPGTPPGQRVDFGPVGEPSIHNGGNQDA